MSKPAEWSSRIRTDDWDAAVSVHSNEEISVNRVSRSETRVKVAKVLSEKFRDLAEARTFESFGQECDEGGWPIVSHP